MTVFNKDTVNPLIHLNEHKDWLELLDICDGWMTEHSLKLLEEYLCSCAKSVLIEKDYHDKDYRDTYYNFYSKKHANYPTTCFRLNFFSNKISTQTMWNLSRYNEEFIGFSIIRPTRINTIGRTVFDPRKIGFVKGFIPLAKFEVHILGSRLCVEGFPYISQDTDLTICAHASCWMIFRYFSQKYQTYAEKLPFQITQLTEDRSLGRLVPSRGITIFQVSEIFANFGFYPLVYDRSFYSDPKLFDRLLYYYIESGLPVVAGMSGRKHAITIIGHYPVEKLDLNGKSSPINVADYVNGFVINDDNFLPYQSLPRLAGIRGPHTSQYNLAEIDSFVVPIYEKIYLPAEHVEALAMSYLRRDSKFDPTNYGLDLNDLVIRILLTSSRSYKYFRVENPIPNNLDRIYRQISMPKFIWLVEITTKALYRDRKVIGEIIFDATASHKDRLAFITIHFPNHLFYHQRDSSDPNAGAEFDLHDALPYAMYENNLKECK